MYTDFYVYLIVKQRKEYISSFLRGHGVFLGSPLSKKLEEIMVREMKDMGTFILKKQCENLQIDPDSIEPNHLPKLSKALAEAMAGFGGPEKAKLISDEIRKLGDQQDMVDKEEKSEGKVEILIDMADTSIASHQWDEALEYLYQAVAIAEEKKDRGLKIKATSKVAYVHREQGEMEKALTLYTKGYETALEIKDYDMVIQFLAGMSYSQWRLGDYDTAEKHINEAQEYLDKAKDQAQLGRTYIEAGNIYCDTKKVDKGLEYYNMAIDVLMPIGDHIQLSRAYNNLGYYLLIQGETQKAAEEIQKAVDEAEEAGDIVSKAWALISLAEAQVKNERLLSAKEKLEEGMDILIKTRDRIGICSAFYVYGLYYTKRKKWAEGEVSFEKSIELAEETKSLPFQAEALEGLGRMQVAMYDKDEAKETFDRALKIFDEIGNEGRAQELRAYMKANKIK